VTANVRSLLCVLVLACGACTKPPAKPTVVRVAGASDLTEAFQEIGRTFETQNPGLKVELSFSSSGLLAKQIEQSAPYDVFAAAGTSFIDDVVKSGACDAATRRVYAAGQLVVWSKDVMPTKLEDLADAHFKKIAIANPDHAPYGAAAKETLIASGLWDAVKDRVVFGDNVRATLQMAQTGNADAALVAASLLVGKPSLAVDPAKHQPISQALVVCSHGGNIEGGKKFADLVTSPVGRVALKQYGLSAP
jgi:molybdate transport system substrate-binding protein